VTNSDDPVSSSGSDSDADPARKPPHKLTIEDKWRLYEEYFMITGIAGIQNSSDGEGRVDPVASASRIAWIMEPGGIECATIYEEDV
jgi:purine nucleoside permease